jgi:hypothetical protein
MGFKRDGQGLFQRSVLEFFCTDRGKPRKTPVSVATRPKLEAATSGV